MAKIETAAMSFRADLMNMARELVWKNQYEASKYEAYITTSVADQYVWAAQKLLEYYSTSQVKQFLEYDNAKFEALLQTAEPLYVKPLRVIRYYTEENDYYRKISGLPPLHPSGYATPEECLIPIKEVGLSQEVILEFGIEDSLNTLYLHQLTTSQLSYIEALGYIARLQEIHHGDKNFDYLKYMTTKKIHPFVARIAEKFQILYLPKATLTALSDDFVAVYERARRFMIERYYTEAYRNKYEFYEGFVGLAILFMTIQQLNVMYLDTDITREFYDLDSIKIVYQAYSVPFYEDIPTRYHAKIVKLINRLLAYKGSNHIIFDLAALFDYEKLTIYQYYLMKTQKLNPDGTPYFQYKDVYDEDGNFIEKELDYEGTYDVHFVKRGIGQESPYEAVNNDANYLDYNGVVYDDQYWLDDADLREKMYKSEYNYIETKYIGLQTQISMAKYFYETVYFMKMLMDNKDVFSNLYIYNNKVGTNVSLFSTVIYLHALLCKKLGWTMPFDTHAAPGCNYNGGNRCMTCYGNIPNEPTKIAKIYGYNFKADLANIMIDCFITDSRHSIYFIDSDGNGLYMYPYIDNKNKASLTFDVYQMEDNTIVKMLGTIKDYPINYKTASANVSSYGLRTQSRDIITRVLTEVLNYLPDEIEQSFETHIVKVKDASAEIFANSYDRTEFIGMLNQIDISNSESVNSVLGVSSLYKSITAVREYIEAKLFSTSDKEVFYAYKHLYKILMTTNVLPEVITKRTYKKTPIYETDAGGNIQYTQDVFGNFIPKVLGYKSTNERELATSYEDLLEDLDFGLSVRLMNMTEDDQLNDEIDYLLIELQKLCDDLKYVTTYGSYNMEVIVEYLYKLIMFFKSVKVQLLNFNIVYLLDSRVDNMFKLMAQFKIEYIKSTLPKDVSLAAALFDFVNKVYDLHMVDDSLITKDVMLQFTLVYHLKSLIIGKDKIGYAYLKNVVDSFVNIFDEIGKVKRLGLLTNKLKSLQKSFILEDAVAFDIKQGFEDAVKLLDELIHCIRCTLLDYAGVIQLTDNLVSIEKESDLSEIVIKDDKLAHVSIKIGPGGPDFVRTIGYIVYDELDSDEYNIGLIPIDENGPILPDGYTAPYKDEDLRGVFNTEVEMVDFSVDSHVADGIWSSEDYYALYFEYTLPTAPYETIVISDKMMPALYKSIIAEDGMIHDEMLHIVNALGISSGLVLKDRLIVAEKTKRYDNYGIGIPDPQNTDGIDTVLVTENNEIIASAITEVFRNPDVFPDEGD